MLKIKLTGLRHLLLVTAFLYQPAFSQSVRIDTAQLKLLIEQWNFANNSRSTETFESVYSDTLLFYTETVSRGKAIGLKLDLFQRKPDFRQRISGGISCTSYATGLVKCDFAKEVLESGRIRVYPSYVLVSYKSGGHRIVGESDYATDKTLGYRLQLGEPLEFEKGSDALAARARDSSPAKAYTQDAPSVSSEALSNREDAIKPFSSMGMISVPKGYVYILIGILIIGGLLIFLADASPSRVNRQEVVLREEQADAASKKLTGQNAFAAFVLTLFDPLFFRHRKLHNDVSFSGDVSEEKAGPDLELHFKLKETFAKFAVKCLYFPSEDAAEFHFPRAQQQRLERFEAQQGMSVYYVVGVGGEPDDPRDLFLIPLNEVRAEFIGKEALNSYRKSGMFFYNRSSGKVQ